MEGKRQEIKEKEIKKRERWTGKTREKKRQENGQELKAKRKGKQRDNTLSINDI